MDEKNETGPAVEPKQEQQCKQARPHDELICELLDSRRPKTEREHAAVREIERLRHDIERHIAIASEYATECERLRAELAECREDAERWRYLRDDGCGFEITVREENEDGYESWVSGYPGAELDAAIDAARKGEGE